MGAAALGLVHLALAGAPARYLVVNACTLVLSLALLALLGRVRLRDPGAMILVAAMVLVATARFGASSEGIARWVRLGPVFLQPSLVLLPAMLIGFAAVPSRLGASGLVVAAVALALQPDRAMAGVLVAGLATLALVRREGSVLVPLAAGLGALGVSLVRPDTLPPTLHVEGVLGSSFAAHPLAGLAVIGGALLLLVPAVVGGRSPAMLVLGAVWLAALVAAALGNYPTPVVGHGGSGILGYVLGLVALPGALSSSRRPSATDRPDGSRPSSPPTPRRAARRESIA